jgi:hypothetical protein
VISLSAGINNLSPGGKDSAMKRVLTLATTGLFVTGLTLLPLGARADEAGKIVPPAATTAGKTTVKTDVQSSTPAMPAGGKATVKTDAQNSASAKDEKKMTSTPGVTTPSVAAPSVAVTKAPAKGAL